MKKKNKKEEKKTHKIELGHEESEGAEGAPRDGEDQPIALVQVHVDSTGAIVQVANCMFFPAHLGKTERESRDSGAANVYSLHETDPAL